MRIMTFMKPASQSIACIEQFHLLFLDQLGRNKSEMWDELVLRVVEALKGAAS